MAALRVRLSPRGAALILAGAALGAGGVAAVHAATAPTAKREALAAAVDPVGAKGRTLGLSRVTVRPGARGPGQAPPPGHPDGVRTSPRAR